VFTDIEGSTRLLENLGESYGEVLAEHRKLLRAAFSSHGGIEVDTQGDAFFFAFARTHDAISAAFEAQQSIWRLIPGRRTQRCGCAWASTPASRFSPVRATWDKTSIARRASAQRPTEARCSSPRPPSGSWDRASVA
jgi:hypothetical protein